MAYTALYNLYRPQSFKEIIGQQTVVDVLRNQIKSKMISHAYLFSGPRGIGKTTIARIFAKAINCTEPIEGEACLKCTICKSLHAKNNLDIIEIDAASNTSVNDIRTLRENVKYMPVAGQYRIYIIDEIHMLSINAFNALLKTLEEPPKHIVFIMATTEPHKIPITVLSRCQRYEFTRISTQMIASYLEELIKKLKVKADKKALLAIARSSAGGMRDALSLLDQMLAMGENNINSRQVSQMLGSADKLLYFALCEAILNEDISRALKGLNTMIEKGCSASTVASDLMQMFRDIYIAKNSSDINEDLMVDDTTKSRLSSIAKRASMGTLLTCLEIFSTLENDLRYARRPEIWLELAVGKACRVQKEDSYENLLKRIERLEKMPAADIKTDMEQQSHNNEDEQEEYFPIKDDDFKKSDINQDNAAADFENENSGYGEDILENNTDEKKSEISIEISEKTIDEKDDNTVNNNDINKGKIIWNKAIDEIRLQKKMRLLTPMKKAEVSGYDGEVLVLSFKTGDEASAGKFENKELKEILKKTLKNITGNIISVKINMSKLNEENKFMQETYDKFPEHLIQENEE